MEDNAMRIHQLFEIQAERAPLAPAALCRGEQVTYREVNVQANQLAHHLRALGVGPGVFVAVYMTRSLDILPALLGILKAGGAYVPLEVSFPPARVLHILSSLHVPIVITHQAALSKLPDLSSLPDLNHVICLDEVGEQHPYRQSSIYLWTRSQMVGLLLDNLPALGSPRNLAYVIFTSGSTGTPKGVMVSHQSVLNVIEWVNTTFQVQARDRILFVTSLCFDLSVYDIFGTLAAGGSIHIATEEDIHDPERLLFLLCHEPITFWDSAPPVLQQVVPFLPTAVEGPGTQQLRLIFLGGDWIPLWMPDKIRQVFTRAQMVNLGGATETTIWSNYYSIGEVDPTWASIPYGKPIQNARYFILDSDFQPCPVGVDGEMYIGGRYLSEGYSNDPALTAEKFLPDPFSEEPGARLYRTGDLGRLWADGNIEFLGRADQQVKVRGFRIELGEIETTLSQHPLVQDVVVIAREYAEREKRIIAYFVPRQEGRPHRTGASPSFLSRQSTLHSQLAPLRLPEMKAPTDGGMEGSNESSANSSSPQAEQWNTPSLIDTLHQFLQERLPEYMLPSAYMCLEKLPLSANGKVDRKALPEPVYENVDHEFVAPRSHLEEMLAEVWANTLGLQRVSTHDNFFMLGGHSLLATQLVTRVRELFQVDLPLISLFHAQTIASFANEVALYRQRQADQTSFHILPAPRNSRYHPLSFPQEQVWFILQLAPENIAYHFQATLKIKGALNVAALEQSLCEIIRRHEMFRTTFEALNGQPVQLIHDPWMVKLPMIDLRAIPGPEQAELIQGYLQQEFCRPFALDTLPLIRWSLLHLGEQEYLLTHIEHHLVHDGWSFNTFLHELFLLYQAFSEHQPSSLPELPVQFVDFVYWQRQWVESEQGRKQLAYWTERLAGSPPLLELPTDHPRPQVQTFHGNVFRIELSPELCEALRTCCRRENVTLYMVMLAAFLTLLSRYTGQEDLCLGTGIANRRSREAEALIGMLINTLVLRADLSGNPTFRDLLARIRTLTLEAYEHQDLPFEKVVAALQPERNLSYNPFFQVIFGFHDSPLDALKLPGMELELTEGLSNGSAKFDLNLIVIPRAEQMATVAQPDRNSEILLLWEYNSDLFAVATMQRMVDAYQMLLEGICLDGTRRLSDIPLLTPQERQQQLVTWNETTLAIPANASLQTMIESWARLTPSATALEYQDERLSYQLLNRRANQLAHYLRTLDVGAESLVAVCLERSPELIISLLAILKAGGAYLPLDPTHPPERLAFMLEDARAQVLLTTNALSTKLADQKDTTTRLVCLESEQEQLTRQSTADLAGGAAPENLAYVIYTSGSTGNPKGVQITHRGLLNLVCWHQQAFTLTAQDRVSQLANLSFDAAGWEIWPALARGATLCLVDEERRSFPLRLRDWLVEQCLTISFLPTPLAENLLETEWHAATALRIMLTGGDLLHNAPALPKPFVLVNNYGPTEYSVVGTSGVVSSGKDESRLPSIGRPIANTRVYVLDAQMQPVPRGVVGELFLGGDGLARGYLHRPDLTAERFLPDPFCQTAGARIYRTGDLVRYRPDGSLDFQGRNDEQVKIRGFRIEPGEIEGTLRQHPAIKEALVIAREDIPGQKQLVAYLVQESESDVPMEQIRQFLQARLPGYMLPTALVSLERIPLTPNGKPDRRALPLPQIGHLEEKYLAPRDPIEELLAGMWAEVLGLERVEIYDNFFALGGHSLLATRVIARIHNLFQTNLPLRLLFERPSVAELAQAISHGEDSPRELAFQKLMRATTRDKQLPLSFAQQRLWFLHQLAPDSPFYNISRAITLTGPLQRTALEQSINELIHRHETLRTRFETSLVQIIDPAPLTFSLPVEELAHLSEEERELRVQQLIQDEVHQPFDLQHGPLLRAKLLHLGQEEHMLLLSLHHIISDGWSMSVLFRELGTLYAAFCADLPSPLLELPLQYADYTLWQHEALTGEIWQEQLAYWKQQLANLPQLALPTDRPRPATQTFKGAYESFYLSSAITAHLKDLSRHEEVTLFMTLLAGFQILLARYSNQTDIVVGTGVANRTRSELENLIGFFVNTLVLRTDLSDNPSVHELLQRIREVALSAYAHQDLPFEQLVEELHPQRDPGVNPLFQVMFVLQNAPQEPLQLSGLALQIAPIHSGSIKFDLHFSLWEATDGLSGMLEYSTDLFEAATIQRLLAHYQHILTAIALQPEQRISALSLLTLAELEQLRSWNATRQDYPQDTGLHRLFEQQVRQTPEAVAICFEDEVLTYEQLNRQADQLAHYLCTLGIQVGEMVGLYMERSPDLIISLLAILKAGAAYVPLDLAYPQERVAFMIQDTHMRFILTQQILLTQLPVHNALTLCLDRDYEEISRQATHDLERDLPGLAPAYVIYTSGSTNVPKGVVVPHRAVARLVINTHYVQFSATERIAQVSNISFDAATFEIWGALLHGGQLIGVSRDVLLDPSALALHLQEQQITMSFLTAALFNQVVQAVPTAFHSLHFLLVGGEALTPRWIKTALTHGRPQHLLNGYGPTENTTFSTTYEIEEVAEGTTMLPIGRPIANTQAYVLDQYMQPVPAGVAGELYLGGDGLALGYLERPDLTAERFVPNPFVGTRFATSELGTRLYKTGDLVRYLPGGEIVFLGRLDTQVKLRGFRIELGEIESVLQRYPGVQDAVVTLHEDATEQKRLVAYVVPDPVALRSQREQLAERVTYWQMVFDEQIYGQATIPADPLFHTAGWNSTITGLPLPAQDMQTWLDDTIQTILELHPRRVLEIGCGTGLLLFRLAADCQSYYGTDISSTSLAYLQHLLSQPAYALPQVKLLQRPANDFSDLEMASFDTIILNSVVQYFPDIEYLLEVLEGALRLLAPGGHVFIGDVRSLPLLEVFHSLVEVEQAAPSFSREYVRERVRQAVRNEEELFFDPTLFTRLPQSYPTLKQVRVIPKRGRYLNELSQFRYQVILRTEEPGEVIPSLDCNWQDWRESAMSLSSLRHLLQEEAPSMLGLTSVPNARLAAALRIYQLLTGKGESSEREPVNVAELHEVAYITASDGLEPEDFWALADELPYDVAISWARHQTDGAYDVLLRRREAGKVREPALQFAQAFPTSKDERPTWRNYANWPGGGSRSHTLLLQLRPHLQEKLPEYMVPSTFLLLDQLPLTPNGKVDRRSLPVPESYAEPAESYIAPRTPVEELLTAIWTEVLGLEHIGTHDNFFDLGGHSLLATQVIVRVRETFRQEVPLRALFEHPTVQELAEAIEALQRLQWRPLEDVSVPPLQHKPYPAELPLSFAQERLWFLAQLEPEAPFYTIAAAFRLIGSLHISDLEKSLQALVNRHEALRTRFVAREGRPIQIIDQSLTLPLPVTELSDLAPSEREGLMRSLVREEVGSPFNLTNGPLLRVRLLCLGVQEHVLLLSMHHLIADGWSLGVFFRELSALYGAFTARRGVPSYQKQAALQLSEGQIPSPLSELPLQYADYTLWQNEWLSGAVLQEQLTYWKRQLANLESLALPTDMPRPVRQRFRGHYKRFQIDTSLVTQLKHLSKRQGVTLFMTLLAGFQILLARYSSQHNIAVGTPIANRVRSELEGLIGLFVNTLVLRGDLSGNPSIRELLQRTRLLTLDAYAHQDVPFEKIVEELNPQRSLSHHPLFQVMFALQNAPHSPLTLTEVEACPLELEYSTSRFDLMLNLYEEAQGLAGGVEYDQDLFKEETIERLIGHYRQILAGMAAQPEQRLSTLPLLTESEQAQLQTWNATRLEYSHELCLHEMIEAQVSRTPDMVAIVWQEEQLTYAELNTRANQLAHYLQKLGIGPEVRVGICLQRSPILVVGLLAILKAGGAYVPLDADYPAERLAFMLADAQVAVLLTQQSLLERLPEHTKGIVCLDTLWQTLASESVQKPSSRVSALNLAYVIYTSGSTGRPKGVAIAHQSSVAFLSWVHTVYSAQDFAGTLAATSVCFDLSIFELFAPLSCGGTVLLSEHILHLPSNPPAWPVTLINTVPSAAAELVRVQGIPRSTRVVNLAGEALALNLVQELFQASEAQRIYNLYGPSEDTTYSTVALLPPESQSPPPIGRPVANTVAYVLDAYQRIVPPGVPGELYLGGDGLARGYLARPDLTAERFLPDPFNHRPGARLYRTGDLSRWRSDGSLEFLGRLDHQVKLRGYRIELAEIEEVLGQLPTIQDAVVVLHEETPENKRLVAYIVAKDGQQPLPTALHHELRTRLPEYMCPSTYMILAALPRTTNGKVNREALPSPVWERPDQEDSYVAPSSPIEEELVRLWAEILELERIGVTDNFFSIGGHSLLAVRLLARISEVFQIELSIHDFFEAPTVAQQATTIGQKRAEQVKPRNAPKPAIKAVARDRYKTNISEQGVLTSSKTTMKHVASAKPLIKAVARTQYKANISEQGALNLSETMRESLALEKSEEK